jgi:heptosyltransferase-2
VSSTRRFGRWSNPAKREAALMHMAVRALAGTLPGPRPAPRPDQVRQILVFGDMGIGNFIMFTPALRALREHYTRAEIVVLFMKSRGMVAVRGLDSVDRCEVVSPAKSDGLPAFMTFAREVRRRNIHPELVVSRWNARPHAAMLTAWLRPAWRVGHVTSAGFEGYCDTVYNFPVSMSVDAHEVERNLDLVRRIGVTPERATLEFPLSQTDHREASRIIESRGFRPDRLICLQIGSSAIQKWKRWPEAHCRALAVALASRGFDLAFVGSPDEAALVDDVLAGTALLSEAGRINLCGSMSIHATGAFMQRARVLVCNDSGLMHAGAALGIPLVAIMGPTEYDRTRPYTDAANVIRRRCQCNAGTLFDRRTVRTIEECGSRCLRDIGPDEVLKKVLEVVDPPRPST